MKHSRFGYENLLELINSIDWDDQSYLQTIDQYRFLTKRGVSRKDLRKYVRIALDIHPGKEWDDVPTRSKNIVRKIETLFETGIGNDNPHVQGTWFAAYQGVTQYLTHEKGRSYSNRMENNWFGQGKNILNRALETAVAMADLSSVA
jgi:hypothetical protein